MCGWWINKVFIWTLCVCICVCVRDRDREREKDAREEKRDSERSIPLYVTIIVKFSLSELGHFLILKSVLSSDLFRLPDDT